jgi:hypothetical protein
MYKNTVHTSKSIICSIAASGRHVIAPVESFEAELANQIKALLRTDMHAAPRDIE